ncbi:alpha/beta hydrolase [Herbiconiux sp. KACC 21604]|uniref:alpha/beta fold hydrolase n=1 Tax=unclassified Herbiconiux TaxID=2618217 RepID=UPI0014930CBE|nr:alpha/beta hydrolase [Herbiconiux sp. SALV-R1]QJU54696.1 alpha/beta hydrolase [Herbiconiux sp. SALV-R1]WPO85800.1 alpha/beta hydrolase [Herbiconiux sp. KACC 21604]
MFGRLRERQAATPTLNVAVDVGSGPVVILLHGIASSSASWRTVVPLLSPLYRVIAIDLLGFGGSRAGEAATFTLDEHVQALHKTVRSLRLRGPFTLVGHSLGGLIAGRYAAVHRKELSHLVLVSPPIYPHRRYIDELGQRLRVGGYLWFYRFVRGNQLTIVNNVGRFSRWMPSGSLKIDDESWAAFSLSMEHCIETQTTMTDLAQVSVPIDVVYGARDQVIVPASLHRLGSMHHVGLHEVPRADHLIREPLAREVARLIR